MKKILSLFFIVLLFVSCSNSSLALQAVDCPTEIKERAYNFAKLYADSDTKWALGKQDPVRSIEIDCSGLIIMSYKYALVDTDYMLFLDDMSAAYMYENSITSISLPEKGDLIFFQDEKGYVDHCGIVDKIENGNVYFIDSTKKDTNADGIYDIDGVTERSYNASDAKIKGYGIMRLKND